MSRTSDRSLFGAELSRLRERAGLSQRAVGDAIVDNGGEKNLTGSAVGEYERGLSAPSPRTAAALERIVGADSGELTTLLGYSATGPVTDEVRALREEVARLTAIVERLDRSRDARRSDGEAP